MIIYRHRGYLRCRGSMKTFFMLKLGPVIAHFKPWVSLKFLPGLPQCVQITWYGVTASLKDENVGSRALPRFKLDALFGKGIVSPLGSLEYSYWKTNEYLAGNKYMSDKVILKARLLCSLLTSTVVWHPGHCEKGDSWGFWEPVIIGGESYHWMPCYGLYFGELSFTFIIHIEGVSYSAYEIFKGYILCHLCSTRYIWKQWPVGQNSVTDNCQATEALSMSFRHHLHYKTLCDSSGCFPKWRPM